LSGDGSMQLNLVQFAPWRSEQRPLEVSVTVPGLIESPMKLVLPGTISVSAPSTAETGSYCVKVTGDCLRLKRWFQYAPATASAR
jgi:hypothetical protein